MGELDSGCFLENPEECVFLETMSARDQKNLDVGVRREGTADDPEE
jgi:hypothetical protein